MTSYLDEQCVISAISWFASVSGCWIFPIEIKSVEFVLAKVADCWFHQIVTHVSISNQFGETVGCFVPATDGQQRFQFLVVSFQSIEFRISTCNAMRSRVGWIFWSINSFGLVRCQWKQRKKANLCQYLAICRRALAWNHWWILQKRRWDACKGTDWCFPGQIWPSRAGRPTSWCSSTLLALDCCTRSFQALRVHYTLCCYQMYVSMNLNARSWRIAASNLILMHVRDK